MSAFGPKRTPQVALHMSAFGGKADMNSCGCPLSRSLSGVKQTCVAALHESAFDPKRTLSGPSPVKEVVRGTANVENSIGEKNGGYPLWVISRHLHCTSPCPLYPQ